MRAEPLDWLDFTASSARLGTFDVILAADVVWVEDLIVPLVECMAALSGPHTTILFAYQSRSRHTDEMLFHSLSRYFTWTGVEEKLHHPMYRNPSKIAIYQISRKADVR